MLLYREHFVFLRKTYNMYTMKKKLKQAVWLLTLLLTTTHCIAQGTITTIAGDGITQYIGDGSPAHSYSLAMPKGMCMDRNGKMYIADYANNRIRTLYHDTLNTICGDSLADDLGDWGLAINARLKNPGGVSMDSAGNIYITEVYNNIIRKIDAQTNIIHTICGTQGTSGYGGDGSAATGAHLANPGGAFADKAGNLYIPDYDNHRIRKVNVADGKINTIAGTGTNGYSGDNSAAVNAKLSYPSSVYVDSIGNVYFTETGNHTVRRIDAGSGIITTVAGSGVQGYTGDGQAATAAKLSEPNGVCVDKQGNIYISDYSNNVIRAVTTDGKIHTIAGTGAYGYTGDNGAPLQATFRGPTAVRVDDSGYIYIADGFNSVIRRISPLNTIITGVTNTVAATITAYPNPAHHTLHIDHVPANAQYVMMNMVNAEMQRGSLIAGNNELPLQELPAGIYLLQLMCATQEKQVMRIVIE
jgi:sugar lactone lactonase YvrE